MKTKKYLKTIKVELTEPVNTGIRTAFASGYRKMEAEMKDYIKSLLPSDEEIGGNDLYRTAIGMYQMGKNVGYIKGKKDLKQEILNKLQIDKYVLESICRCGIPAPDADRECCTICGKLIYPE